MLRSVSNAAACPIYQTVSHFVTATALETALGDYMAHYNQTAQPIKWTYTVQELEQRLGTHL